MVDCRDRLVLGTAAIGLPYGLARRDPTAPPPDEEVRRLLAAAHEAGIRTVDTAPAYGCAEERLGRWWPTDARVWTKLGKGDPIVSLGESCRLLQRQRIEVVQWHNWTARLLSEASFLSIWKRLANDARCLSLGASTYGPEDAIAAVSSGLFSVVQVEWNLLNQAAVMACAAIAQERGVALAVRSVLLQGALAGAPLPERLRTTLTPAITAAQTLADSRGMTLARLAIRAALDQPGVRWVLIGADREAQVEDALSAALLDPLSPAEHASIRCLDRSSDPAVDPRTWH